MHNEIIIYKNGELELPVEVTSDKETVWLNRNQLTALFERNIKTIDKHINNALKEDLDNSTIAKFATTASDGKNYKVDYHNLDIILDMNHILYKNNKKIPSDSTLVALTLLIAESKPQEKEIMIN